MRFFLDENESEAILAPLRVTYYAHEFRSAAEEGLRGVDDRELIPEVARRGFDGLITQDRNQLSNRYERQAYIDTGLHWIGHKEPTASGLMLVAVTTAAYLAAFPHILSEAPALSGAHAFHVRNLQAECGQRVRWKALKT